MQDYLDRLTSCGIRLDDAMVIISDFLRELDFDGLNDYCKEIERRYVEAL